MNKIDASSGMYPNRLCVPDLEEKANDTEYLMVLILWLGLLCC